MQHLMYYHNLIFVGKSVDIVNTISYFELDSIHNYSSFYCFLVNLDWFREMIQIMKINEFVIPSCHSPQPRWKSFLITK